MRTPITPQSSFYGVYQGEVTHVRYHKGVIFVRVKLAAGSQIDDGAKYDWVTSWARVVSPMVGAISEGEGRYGAWFSPKKGDIAVIAFEQGMQSQPVCLGFCARIADTPPEFENDDYLDKEAPSEGNPDDREDPPTTHPEINMAQMLKTLALYLLLHQKTNHLVIDAAKMDGEPDPRIELGEGATANGYNVALGSYFVEQFLKHTHDDKAIDADSVDSTDAEDYLSEFVFINKEPRDVDKPGTSTEGRNSQSLGGIISSIADFAKDFCKFITKADEFMDDPVGTLTTGITDGLAAAAGDMPDIDVDDVVNEASDFVTNLGTSITTEGKATLKGWAGVDGALGALLTGGQTDAMQAQVDGLDLSGLADFVNNGGEKLMDMAADAGLTEALNALDSDILGSALDAGIALVSDTAADVIGESINGLIPDVPFVESALDIASGLCQANLAQTVSGLFSFAVDGINTLTGGALTPFTDAIKTIGGGLIEGLFNGEGLPSGKEMIDMVRAGD